MNETVVVCRVGAGVHAQYPVREITAVTYSYAKCVVGSGNVENLICFGVVGEGSDFPAKFRSESFIGIKPYAPVLGGVFLQLLSLFAVAFPFMVVNNTGSQTFGYFYGIIGTSAVQ